MAGVLTSGPAGFAPSVPRTTRALVRMRRSLRRNAPGGSGMVATGVAMGVALAAGTVLLGLLPLAPDRLLDLLATLVLGWLIGWVMGPIAFRGSGQGLRPEYFALLPIRPAKLAAGLLGVAFTGFAPAITLLALGVLLVAAIKWGVAATLVAVPAALLQLTVVVLLSKVVVAALTAVLSSRRGRDLGGLLMAVVVALASGGWSVAIVMGEQIAAGPAPALSAILRILPSGWGPVAVAAAGRSDWPLALGALAALAVLSGLLLLAWAALLVRNMRRHGGWAAESAGRGVFGAGKVLGWWPQAAGPTGAVMGKELRTWRRDPGRRLIPLLGLMLSALNLGLPAVVFDVPALLPWVGPAAALFASIGTVNLYGEEGTALWLTRMMPGTERADVRGRQAAWLLVIGPVMVVLTVTLTALAGQNWAWPWVLATLPAMLGGTAGLMVAVSVLVPIKQKDPDLRGGPLDVTDDPNASGALVGLGYLMLLLVALSAAPAGLAVLLGTVWAEPALRWSGIPVGLATGALFFWWGGRFAARRLSTGGAELMDMLHLGPDAPARALPSGRASPAPRPSAVLWMLALLCMVPQGLVPIGLKLLDADQQIRVWFVARYLPYELQVPAAVAFVVVGLLAAWWAESLRRRYREPSPVKSTPSSYHRDRGR